jgi:hypothetical protein
MDAKIHINRHRKERAIPSLKTLFLVDKVIYSA